MGSKHVHINAPILIKRIQEAASLSESQKGDVHRFSKKQLLELFAYVTEMGRTVDELKNKITELQKGEH